MVHTHMYTSPEYTYSLRPADVPAGHQTIRGVAAIPDAPGPFPLIVTAHGLGGTYRDGLGYADVFCPYGFAVYTFDFRGGSPASMSDGSTTEMSVLTEACDLEAVVLAARSWPFVRSDEIVLLGSSQGGMAAAVCAGRIPDSVRGLVLCYPAFGIPDEVRKTFASIDVLPDSYMVLGFFPAGRRFGSDVYGYYPFSEIEGFRKPVLLLHGSCDPIVPPRYSIKAAGIYKDAELHIIEGAGHGFVGPDFDKSTQLILSYLRRVLS